MATCIDCRQEMATAAACSVAVIPLRSGILIRRPWGSESSWKPREGERCPDCAVLPGGLHHLGCDVEECADCGHQLLSCGCLDLFDEFELVDELLA
jgi:hypothetical protein